MPHAVAVQVRRRAQQLPRQRPRLPLRQLPFQVEQVPLVAVLAREVEVEAGGAQAAPAVDVLALVFGLLWLVWFGGCCLRLRGRGVIVCD